MSVVAPVPYTTSTDLEGPPTKYGAPLRLDTCMHAVCRYAARPTTRPCGTRNWIQARPHV